MLDPIGENVAFNIDTYAKLDVVSNCFYIKCYEDNWDSK